MEAFFSTLTTALAYRFESCGEAKVQLFDYIDGLYNQRRLTPSLGTFRWISVALIITPPITT